MEPLYLSGIWCCTSGGMAVDSDSRDAISSSPTGAVHGLLPVMVAPDIDLDTVSCV